MLRETDKIIAFESVLFINVVQKSLHECFCTWFCSIWDLGNGKFWNSKSVYVCKIGVQQGLPVDWFVTWGVKLIFTVISHPCFFYEANYRKLFASQRAWHSEGEASLSLSLLSVLLMALWGLLMAPDFTVKKKKSSLNLNFLVIFLLWLS